MRLNSSRRTKNIFRGAACVLAALCCLAGTRPVVANDDSAAKKLPADLALVPPDALFLVSLDAGTNWNGPEKDSLLEISRAHPIVITHEALELEKTFGLAAGEIDRVLVIVPRSELWVAVFTTLQPFDRDKVIKKVAPGAAATTVAGKTCYFAETGGLALCPLDGRTLLMSTREGLKSFLEHPAPADSAAANRPFFDAVQKKAILVAELNPAMFPETTKQAVPDASPLRPLFDAKSCRVTLEARDGLRMQLQAEFESEEAAKKGMALLDAVPKQLDVILSLAEERLPPFFDKQQEKFADAKKLGARMDAIIKAARAGLKGVAATQTGKFARLDILVDTKEPVTSAMLLLSLVPRAKRQ